MSTVTLKNSSLHALISSLRFSKLERITLWVILWTCVVDSILFVYFIGLIFFFNVTSYAQAVAPDTKVGPVTERFILELKKSGLDAIPLQRITRTPFSVRGNVITIQGDNIQVFEYPSHDSALKEASVFAEKYVDRTKLSRWKNSVHLYAKDTLAIFYMGNDKNILDILDKSAEVSLIEPRVLISDRN